MPREIDEPYTADNNSPSSQILETLLLGLANASRTANPQETCLQIGEIKDGEGVIAREISMGLGNQLYSITVTKAETLDQTVNLLKNRSQSPDNKLAPIFTVNDISTVKVVCDELLNAPPKALVNYLVAKSVAAESAP